MPAARPARHLLLLSLALAGCQYLPAAPKPEHVAADSPLLQLPAASAGILVLPVANASDLIAQPLAAAMAEALCAVDLPADTDSSNRRSFRLQGTLETPGGKEPAAVRQIRWQMMRADGSAVGEIIQPVRLLPRDWAKPPRDVLVGLARTQAPAIAALLEEPVPVEIVETLPPVLLYPVAGAPGDGQRSLTLALGRALADAGITVIDPNPKPSAAPVSRPNARTGTGVRPKTAGGPAVPENAVAIAGSVAVGKAEGTPKARQQHVKITWSVLDQNGATLGSIDQENDVPAGTLDGSWGEVAPVVASAAIDGIVPLLRRLGGKAPA